MHIFETKRFKMKLELKLAFVRFVTFGKRTVKRPISQMNLYMFIQLNRI